MKELKWSAMIVSLIGGILLAAVVIGGLWAWENNPKIVKETVIVEVVDQELKENYLLLQKNYQVAEENYQALWGYIQGGNASPTEMITATSTVTETLTPSTPTPTLTATATLTITSCCSIFVNLDQVPKGIWSNASAVLMPEGWCVVLQRNQLWQQTRDKEELRQTWQEGATEDFLLLCNPGPGSRFFSLEESYGGRPGGHEGFWNDQVKRIWLFPDPNSDQCGQPGVRHYFNLLICL